MTTLFKNAYVYTDGQSGICDAFYDGASLTFVAAFSRADRIIENCIILPGFCDVHAHFREPGFLYKEDIASGSLAAAHGGYTAVCTMPNLSPCPDSVGNLTAELDAIKSKAIIPVYPFGAVTVGEKGKKLSDMSGMSPFVIGFSDDGKGIQSGEMMSTAMLEARRLGKIISAHCEVNSLLNGGYIHDGEYARLNGHKGICSESEWQQIERDISFAAKTGCSYHVCHISAKESVDLIRQAKRDGIDITCETAPHYLLLDDMMLCNDGRYKMNPPIRSAADREALLEGICDGTVDMIATDHAPHSAVEKSGGLRDSLMGVTGLECAFSVLYEGLVKNGRITLEKLTELMSKNPRKRFGITDDAGFCVWRVEPEYKICAEGFYSRGKSTPFDGCMVSVRNILTMYNGKAVYEYKGDSK